MPVNLKTKKVLITGASSGIGKAFGVQLAEAGFRVTLVARSETQLNDVKNTLSGTGHEVIVADLATQSGLSTVDSELATGSYSMLVNNAGFGWIGHSDNIPQETIERMISLNIAAVTQLSLTFLRNASSDSVLINVASILGLIPFPPQNLYAASKAFVMQFTVGLWEEYTPRGIKILALCPGATDTLFFERAGKSQISRWRQMMSPDDVVEMTLKTIQRSNNPIFIPGLKNKLFVWFMRHSVGMKRAAIWMGVFGRKF